jgi:hypothetical protein
MRQPAVAVDQPDIPAALRVILGALPNDRLAGLLYELARVAGVIAMPEPTPLPATAGKRGPGWPKGRPRGPRKVRTTEPTTEPTVEKVLPAAPAKSLNAKLKAKRNRANAARRAKRAAARAGNGKANGTQDSSTSAIAHDAASAKRARHAHNMRVRRARDAAARQTDGTDKAADAAAAAMWERALELAPKAPWKAIERAFHVNAALALDAWRSRELPPGVTPVEVAQFVEPAPS